METTLHRQLKTLYSTADREEVWVDGFRIDAIQGGRHPRLVEIQSASLAQLRDKSRKLLAAGHRLLIVKPLAARKQLLTRAAADGDLISRRLSPLHETFPHLFHELVHFVTVFPHPRLTLEVLLTEQEEDRLPVAARRRRQKNYRVADRRLITVMERLSLTHARDLLQLLPADLTGPFTTADLAAHLRIPRWLAQKMAYCLDRTGAAPRIGKLKHAWLYQPQPKKSGRRAA